MGRELKRVALDFDWPLNQRWEGYLNPHYVAVDCTACAGTGYSPTAKLLHDKWYGKIPFKPEDRGSAPFTTDDTHAREFAENQCRRTPSFYGMSEYAVRREADRIVRHWNNAWCHHLNNTDVAALVAADRLHDFTHTFEPGKGWRPITPAPTITAREVNVWSCSGMGHDSINAYVVIQAECARLGEPYECAACDGEGNIWSSSETKAVYDAWEPYEPPVGEGYQIWETVSEGSPISPVFSTPEDLARYMTTTRWGADTEGTPYDTWLAFIRGPGWAPSLVGTSGRLVDGVTGIVGLKTETAT